MISLTLRGGGTCAVDDKGRVIVPQRFRKELGEQYVIVRGLEKCLYMFAKADLEELAERLRAMPVFGRDKRAAQRYFLSDAWDVTSDVQGRIQLSHELRQYAGIKPSTQVKVVGCGSWIEIWDKEAFELTLADVEDKIDLEGMMERAWSGEAVSPPSDAQRDA